MTAGGPTPPRGALARASRALAVLAAACAAAWCAPGYLLSLGADALYDGEAAAQLALARGVAGRVGAVGGRSAPRTGSARFDQEWALVTDQMTVLGLAQVVRAHPQAATELGPAMARSARALAAPESFSFGAEAWGTPLPAALAPAHDAEGHAYLGYAALGLGVARRAGVLADEEPAARTQRAMAAALLRRVERALDEEARGRGTGLLETYPGETYPADNAAVIGALGVHSRLADTGPDEAARARAAIARWEALVRRRYVHRESGYLVQEVSRALPRGSGTAISAYFLSFSSPSLARELGDALARRGHATFAGFGGVREYAGGREGAGDIDSGPVVFGVGVSATGFALASARQRGDRARFLSLLRTARLFGVPVCRGGGVTWVAGGGIGDAILLAMLTAEPLAPGSRGGGAREASR